MAQTLRVWSLCIQQAPTIRFFLMCAGMLTQDPKIGTATKPRPVIDVSTLDHSALRPCHDLHPVSPRAMLHLGLRLPVNCVFHRIHLIQRSRALSGSSVAMPSRPSDRHTPTQGLDGTWGITHLCDALGGHSSEIVITLRFCFICDWLSWPFNLRAGVLMDDLSDDCC